MKETLAGVVLAGGYSSRFGTDKCTFELDGRPMVSHVTGALAPLAGETYLLASSRSAPILSQYGEVMEDVDKGRGPAHALVMASRRIQSDLILVLPCDMPCVTTAGLEKIVESHRASGAVATVATDSNGRLQPLVACYDTRRLMAIPTVEPGSNRSSSLSMHNLLSFLNPVVHVELPDTQLVNINRPSDLPS